MINNVTLVGRLTKDVELKFTPAGKAVASGTIAVNRNFKGQNGETEADFINIVIWGKQAENTANFTRKGSLIGITGRIQVRNYQNSEGKRIYITEVVAENVQFLDSRKDNNQGTNTSRTQEKPNTSQSEANTDPFGGGQLDVNSDDLPF